jgi:hypothetical protein
MKTRHPKSRVIASLLGLWAARILVETVAEFLRGRPEGCLVKSYGGFCWVDSSPEVQFCLVVTPGCVLRFYALPVWLFRLCVRDEPTGSVLIPASSSRRADCQEG